MPMFMFRRLLAIFSLRLCSKTANSMICVPTVERIGIAIICRYSCCERNAEARIFHILLHLDSYISAIKSNSRILLE
jgi:hypothetical protein